MQIQRQPKTFMDFCAGIGAGRQGLEKAGLSSVGYSEIESTAIATYNILHNIEIEINYNDLTKIKTKDLPEFDVMIAGFPCQTFSVIGKGRGMEDERGQIIYFLANILKEKKTPYFILENVKGLLTHDRGRTIKIIIKNLEDAGYSVEFKVLNSIDYGVPQMRERIYFVGIRKDLIRHERKYQWPEKVTKPSIKDFLIDTNNEISKSQLATFERYLNSKTNQGKKSLQNILKMEYAVIDTRQSDLRIYKERVPTIRRGRQGIYYVKNGVLRNLTGYEGMLLQGFSKNCASKIRNMPSTTVLALVGNAMTVTVIEALANSLIEYIKD